MEWDPHADLRRGRTSPGGPWLGRFAAATFLVFTTLYLPEPGVAQALKQITLDLKGGTLSEELPFDEPFLLVGDVPVDAQELKVRYLSRKDELRVTQATLCDPTDDPALCRRRQAMCELDPNSQLDGKLCFLCFARTQKNQKKKSAPAAPAPVDARVAQPGEEPADCPRWEPAQPLTWSYRDLQWAPPGGSTPTNRRFSVSVPPLDAERYYVLHVSLRASSQGDARIQARTATIRDKARASLIDAYASLARVPEANLAFLHCLEGAADAPAECSQLLTDLCKAVTPRPDEGLDFEFGSLCDESQRLRLGIAARPLISDLDANREAIGDALEERRASQSRLEEALDLLHLHASPATTNGPALAKLFASIDAAAKQTPPDADTARFVRILQELAPARDILEADDNGRISVSLGFPASERRLTEHRELLTNPAIAAGMATSYRATANELARLESALEDLATGFRRLLVDRLVGQAAVRKLPPGERLTVADLSGRRGSLEDTIELLAKSKDFAFAAAETSQRIADRITALQKTAQGLADMIAIEKAAQLFILDGRTYGSFGTQQQNYISADFGLAYMWNVGKVVPTVGANIYTRPVNKKVPLSLRGGFRRRFALTVGATVTGIADGGSNSSPVTREDLVTSHSLLLGVGFRLSDSARVSTGALVFYERRVNPLRDRRDPTYSPFVALSFDYDVLTLFKSIFTSFGIPGG